jgi:hypothetical protein
MRSAIKAGMVFFATVGSYYLAKTTGIFSYFEWGEKTKNSKDVDSREIMEIKSRENALNVGRKLETIGQTNSLSINRIEQTYKDEGGTVEFEEIKVKNLLEVGKKNVGMRRSSSRRSISVQNPIPDQNVTVGELFELTINGASIFNSNTVFVNATNIPTWITSFLLFKSHP